MATLTNESSLLMQARWDWADNTIAGKWGTSQQVYRHKRQFMLGGSELAGDLPDGQPIVIARNKVRGRGRALHLSFVAEAGKDAHILGWSTNFIVLTDN